MIVWRAVHMVRACLRARTIQSAALCATPPPLPRVHMLRTHVVHVTGGDGQLLQLADDAILAYKGPLVIVSH